MTMMRRENSFPGNRTLAALVLSAGVVLFALVTLAVPQELGGRLIADDGLVQLATFVVLCTAVMLAIRGAIRDPDERVLLGLTAFMLVIYAAREADLHRAKWVPEHFSSSRFYLSADVPVAEKIVCGSFLMSLVIVAVMMVARGVPKIAPAFRSRQPWLMFSVAWACVFVASQISDQSSWNEVFAGQAFEEIAEFVAAGFVVLAVLSFSSDEGMARAVDGDAHVGMDDDSHAENSRPAEKASAA